MSKLISDLLAYLRAIFLGTRQIGFTIFEVLVVVLFLCPKLAGIFTSDESLARTVAGLIFFISFLLANFTLYIKLADAITDQADIRLEVVEKSFSPSSGSVSSPFPGVPKNLYGFTENGLPDWCYLWAHIEAKNIGPEVGRLVYELDKAKTKLPSLFDLDRSRDSSEIPSRFEPGRLYPDRIDLYLNFPLTEREPQAFAQSLKDLVKYKRRYWIVLRYKTLRVSGESQAQPLVIEGDFQDFYQKVLNYWGEGKFKDLADLARM